MPYAVGIGPIGFTDPNGNQIYLPLSALTFDSHGVLAIDPTKWPPFAGYTGDVRQVISNLLADLSAARIVVPAVAAPPRPALRIKAADAGAAGNNIQVTTTLNPATPDPDPTLITFDVTVTETDTYPRLAVANIQSVLGTGTGNGTQPGLVHIVAGSVQTGRLPNNRSYTMATYSPPASPPASSARVDVKDASDQLVFTLEAKKPDIAAQLTQVAISNVDTASQTFTLAATWSKTVTGVTIGTVQQKLADLGYEISVAPPGGGAFAVPENRTITLSGGAGGSAPTFAFGTLYALS